LRSGKKSTASRHMARLKPNEPVRSLPQACVLLLLQKKEQERETTAASSSRLNHQKLVRLVDPFNLTPTQVNEQLKAELSGGGGVGPGMAGRGMPLPGMAAGRGMPLPGMAPAGGAKPPVGAVGIPGMGLGILGSGGGLAALKVLSRSHSLVHMLRS